MHTIVTIWLGIIPFVLINRFFMKLFRTNNIDTVKTCQSEFGIKLPTILCWHVEKKNFCVKLISVIIICYVCSVRLLRLVTPLCVCIVCSCLHYLIKSALLLACIWYHSWRIKDEYIYIWRERAMTVTTHCGLKQGIANHTKWWEFFPPALQFSMPALWHQCFALCSYDPLRTSNTSELCGLDMMQSWWLVRPCQERTCGRDHLCW